MNNNTLFIGVGGAIVGLFLGYLFFASDTGEMEGRLAEKIDGQAGQVSAAMAEKLAAMDGKLAALEAKLAEVGGAVAAGTESQAATAGSLSEQLTGAVSSLSQKVDGMSNSVAASIAKAGDAQTANVQAALTSGLGALSESVGRLSAAPAGGTDTDVSITPTAPEAPKIEGARAGQTELLLEGKAKVFVSSVNADAGTARVAVNGLTVQEIGGWQETTFEIEGKLCTLKLDRIVQRHVQMSVTCGQE